MKVNTSEHQWAQLGGRSGIGHMSGDHIGYFTGCNRHMHMTVHPLSF